MFEKYDFGIVRLLRQRNGWTIKDLAERSGLTYPTIEAIEINKSFPSLRTLDQVAVAFGLSSSNLLSLCEKVRVIRQSARFVPACSDPSQIGIEICRVASYDQAKLIRIQADAGQEVRVMKLHDDVYEFCYALSGTVELTIQDTSYILESDETVFFDGLLEHGYRQIKKGEYFTFHIPKKNMFFQSMLGSPLAETVPAAV